MRRHFLIFVLKRFAMIHPAKNAHQQTVTFFWVRLGFNKFPRTFFCPYPTVLLIDRIVKMDMGFIAEKDFV